MRSFIPRQWNNGSTCSTQLQKCHMTRHKPKLPYLPYLPSCIGPDSHHGDHIEHEKEAEELWTAGHQVAWKAQSKGLFSVLPGFAGFGCPRYLKLFWQFAHLLPNLWALLLLAIRPEYLACVPIEQPHEAQGINQDASDSETCFSP